MALTDINGEDRLVQQTFADHLRDVLGWESVYAYNTETFGPGGTLGRANEREVVLVRDLRAALARLNPDIPEAARQQAILKLTREDFARSLVGHVAFNWRPGICCQTTEGPASWASERGDGTGPVR